MVSILKVLYFILGSAIIGFLLIKIHRNKKEHKNSLLLRYHFILILTMFLRAVFSFINEILYYNTNIYNTNVYLITTSFEFFVTPILVIITVIIIKNKLPKKINFIFIFPIISTIMHLTNKYHHLFYEFYNPKTGMFEKGGSYLIFHLTYFYGCWLFPIVFLLFYAFKNKTGMSKQIFLFLIGLIMPFAFIILSTFKIYLPSFPFKPYVRQSMYLFYTFTITYAVYKYRFFSTVPFAFSSIIDNMRDSFLAVDLNGKIIEKNELFIDEFCTKNKSPVNLCDCFKELDDFKSIREQMEEHFKIVTVSKNETSFEYRFVHNQKFYNIEFKPIPSKENLAVVLILFKDISEQKQILKLTEENAVQIAEKSRLTLLNNLIGGIAHNIKSPLMSSAGGMLIIKNHTDKLYRLLKNNENYETCKNILDDMSKWEDNIKNYLMYISDIISTVKEQSTNLNHNKESHFTISEILKKIDILIGFELKKYHCKLNKILNTDTNETVRGDIVVLTQILNNVIINAMQSYENGGLIEFTILKDKFNIIFTIKDYGIGIESKIKDKLLKQMITTKGINGTGLGLYISNIALRGMFKGSLNIESEVNMGTTINIKIPN